MPDKISAVFIDRDGTMGDNANLLHPQDFVPFPFVAEAVAILHRAAVKVFAFSNQSCLARGLDGGYDFKAEFLRYGMDDSFICPHDDADRCLCRKPEPGLLLEARAKYGLDLKKCVVVGDRWSDMAAGGKVGAHLVLVRTGRGADALGCDRAKWSAYRPDFVADHLLAAARFIAENLC